MPGRFGVSRLVTTIAGGLCMLVLCSTQAISQLAKGQSRFLGNALSSGMPIHADFGKYWNQVTPGNAGKWESVEGFQGSYDWTWLDAIYNYAINNSYPFKDHCLIWGAQQPGWIAGLDSAHQRAKVEQWIDTVGGRYGSMSMVDVVNEPFNGVPVYKNALGGDGKTGWDWVVTAFEWARKYCMKGTKLLINEYNVLQDPAVTTRYLALIDTLRVRGLVDGIGIQGHYFEFKSFAGSPSPYSYPVPTLKANLERLTATGLPVYITEFEINEASDSIQLANYKIYFPLFWENPGVKGITHWGYKQGDMWKENGYLVRSNGTERPALQWLRTYVVRPIPPVLVSPVGTTEPRNPRLVWRTSALASSYRVQVASNSAFSSIVVDSTAPSASVSEPAAGQTLTGDVVVAATAADDVDVQRVEFRLDGSVFAVDDVAPFSSRLDTTQVADGTHALTARAVDTSGNSTISPDVDVTVANTAPSLVMGDVVPSPFSPNGDGVRDVATLSYTLLAPATTSVVVLAQNESLVRVLGADGGALDSCLLAFGGGAGLALTAGADGWDVTGCEFHANGRAGVSLESSGGLRLALARLSGHAGAGVDAATSTGGCRFDSLSVSRNGLAAAAGVPDAGIRLDGDGSTVSRCALEDNVGAGVLVMASSRANVITRNRIAGNGTVPGAAGVTGQIGIDLLSDEDDDAHGTAPFVTLNGKGDGDRGGNRLLNFPVLASAVLANGQVTVSGWARPGSTIELFVAALDPTGFGEGRTWLATFVEGSAADLDATSSSYTGEVNGLAQGSDNTRRFRFTLAAPPGLAAGVPLTATGMLAASGTSEFSGRVFVTTGVSLRGTAYADADHNARLDAGETGTGAALWAKLVPDGAAAAVQVAPVDAASGAYELAFVSAGTYAVVLDDGADADDLVPGRPAGWIGTEAPDGTVAGVAVAATDLGGLDFGLWHGSRVDGTVFRDDGAGGGLANDGAPAGGESGLAGARVRLLSAACADGACDSATTDATGTFRLWLPQAAAGATASVSEVNPAGWISTGGGSGSTGGSYARAADAVTFTAAAGVAYGGVTFGDVPPNAWAPPLARTILAGGVALYAHTFTAGSAGTVSLAVAETPVPALPGWAVTLYHDADGDGVLDAGETPLAGPVTLAAGQSLCVIARHASPAGAPPGAAETAALTATYAYANAVPALESQGTLSDVTTIALTNGLVLVKGVDLATVPPGGSLDYTITYLNPGPQGLSSIVIHDVTPAWTVFESAGCVTLGAGLTGCALTSQPAAGEAGDVAWTLDGTLAPGASGSVTFRVRVR